MPIYSFGVTSPAKFSVSEEDAEAFNRLQEKLWAAPLTLSDQEKVYQAYPEDALAYWRVVEAILATLSSMGERSRNAKIEGRMLVQN